jgi:hypothetical protein
MAWDNSRPVPWQRLMREWLIYAGIMGVIFVFFFRDSNLIGALAGVFISGPLYLIFGSVLAKFGYQRKTMKELRSTSDEQPSKRSSKNSAPSSDHPRSKPAPTSRTASGPNRPTSSKRRR